MTTQSDRPSVMYSIKEVPNLFQLNIFGITNSKVHVMGVPWKEGSLSISHDDQVMLSLVRVELDFPTGVIRPWQAGALLEGFSVVILLPINTHLQVGFPTSAKLTVEFIGNEEGEE